MQLTRRRIVATATGLLEHEGTGAVSMSRLATELGSSLMALYHHVPSKSSLLDEVAAEALAGLATPAVTGGWPDQVKAQVVAVREAVATRPWCALLLAAQPRRALGAARAAENVLAALQAAGFARQDAIRIVRALAAYLLGTMICQPGALPDLVDQAAAGPRLRRADFPLLAAGLAEPADPVADFEFGLGLLLSGAAGRQAAGAFDRPAVR
jgi:AcrR family transcriptional regulator